jgi:hypothetical protein
MKPSCGALNGCAQIYFHDELDSVSAANIERHRIYCAECSALLDDLE